MRGAVGIKIRGMKLFVTFCNSEAVLSQKVSFCSWPLITVTQKVASSDPYPNGGIHAFQGVFVSTYQKIENCENLEVVNGYRVVHL